MTTYIPEALRKIVHDRAKGQCEYCLIHERYTMKRHEIDHIYAEKHGGLTADENLCLSCFDCNRTKGSDLCSLDAETGEIVTLFHPRRDEWVNHFKNNAGEITGLTPKGRATLRSLNINDTERIVEREDLARIGAYP